MRWVHHLEALHDFIGFVVMRAPDRFPKEDFLEDADQLSLDSAFDELRSSLRFVVSRDGGSTLHDRLLSTLDASLTAYRAGDRKQGAHLLQDFRDMIFGARDNT